ncbi:MAG: hypothetical protein KF891_13520 [Rhizobacter sp.]|nr:hypothetical protein [Rhizobacter sp.]
MDTTTLGVVVMLPGVLAALAPNKKVKGFGLMVSLLLAIVATLGWLR